MTLALPLGQLALVLEGLLHDSPLLEQLDPANALHLFGRQGIGGGNACDGDRGDQDARGR